MNVQHTFNLTNSQFSELYYKCEEVNVCQNNLSYVIDEASVWSLKSEFNMVCENSHLQKESLAIALRGSLVKKIKKYLF